MIRDSSRTVHFDDLANVDLVVDAQYDGGSAGTAADDPLARLLPVGNQGGFRYAGSPRRGSVRLGVLYTDGGHRDWPDTLNPSTGIFTYYGDNRAPGALLHETHRGGNVFLRDIYAWSRSDEDRPKVPPLLLFEKVGPRRRIAFRGLIVPGGKTMPSDDELQAIWRSAEGQRFQNYRAHFSVLAVPVVSRAWLQDIERGQAYSSRHCPQVWQKWVDRRIYEPLVAPSTTAARTKAEQLPDQQRDQDILDFIREHYRGHEHGFERCAVELWRLIAPSTGRCDVTQPSRDGGRDAIGEYIVGPESDPIAIDFALEAKCYSKDNAVSVSDVARLISRIRYRNFGVFVTTSYFGAQVYAEVRADQHPIVLISGSDIVAALRKLGLSEKQALRAWLDQLSE